MHPSKLRNYSTSTTTGTGEGSYLSSKDDDYAYALELAEILDQYNNGELCTP